MIEACDKALEAKEKQVIVYKVYNRELMDQNMLLQNKVMDKEEELNKFYRNPVTMGTIGVLLGLVVAGIAGIAK